MGTKIVLPAPADWSLGTGLEVSGDVIQLSNIELGDEFGSATEQDFVTGGDGAKSYDWYILNSANLDAGDAHTTNSDNLTLNSDATSTTNWNSSLTGPWLYKAIAGDFTAVLDIAAHNGDANFENCGLMARDTTASAGEDWTSILAGWWAGGRSIDSVNTVNDVSSEVFATAGLGAYPVQLKLVRTGNVFTKFYKMSGGSFVEAQSYTRSDFTSSIQVGIIQNTGNTSDTFVTQFSNLSILNGYSSSSPEAESPWMAIGYTTLDATTPIDVTAGGTGTVNYQYAINNGSYNGSWLTEAQLKSGLASATISNHTNSLRIKAQFVSDGSQTATMTLTQPDEYVLATGAPSGSGGGLKLVGSGGLAG